MAHDIVSTTDHGDQTLENWPPDFPPKHSTAFPEPGAKMFWTMLIGILLILVVTVVAIKYGMHFEGGRPGITSGH
jgi:hypothetical protein